MSYKINADKSVEITASNLDRALDQLARVIEEHRCSEDELLSTYILDTVQLRAGSYGDDSDVTFTFRPRGSQFRKTGPGLHDYTYDHYNDEGTVIERITRLEAQVKKLKKDVG